MSILLGLTYTGLRAATRSSQRGELLLAAGGELRASHQFIRRQLNQMLPLPFAVTDDTEDRFVLSLKVMQDTSSMLLPCRVTSVPVGRRCS